MNPIEQWIEVFVPPKSSISLSPEYINQNGLRDDLMLAIVFKYPDSLCKRLYILAMPTERINLINLFNQKKIYCEMDINSNIIIHN